MVCRPKIGCKRERAIITRQCFFVAAETFERVAAIVVYDGVAGALRQRPIETLQRFFMALKRVEDHAVTRERVCRSGPRLQRRGDEAQTINRSALLMFEKARQVQRVAVLRIGRQNGVVNPFRVVELPAPVQRQRLFERAAGLRTPRGPLLRHDILIRSMEAAGITGRSFAPLSPENQGRS